MNYYPFHIGDYLSATRHLSWDEDAAYRRLLDTYYTTEKPLPLDLRAVCRLVVASTEEQRHAVQVVLEEFFVQTPDGWVNSRADEEIKAAREKSEQTGERTEHEKTRKERYRERRAFLFAFLRSRDVVPEYDIGMKQLLELAERNGWDKSFGTAGNVPDVPLPSVVSVPGGVPVERDRNVPVDALGTAIPTPTPTPTPKSISSEPFRASEPVSSFAIPLVDGTDYQVTVRELDEWSRAYPAVDVPKELRQMRVWCMANSTKRKTRRGAPAFAVKWLAKAQDTPSHHRRNLATPADDWTGGAL